MRTHLSRRYRLSASHRLFQPGLDLAANLELFGKCAHPHGHGHNYVVEATVSGAVDPGTGMVIDLVKMDNVVKAKVVEVFDHTNLNLHACFNELVPTTENFCIEIYRRLLDSFGTRKLERVRVEETSNNSFEYAGG